MTTATIELQARSGQIRTATNDLQRLENQGQRANRTVQLLTRSFAALGGAAVIGVAIRNTAQFGQAIADLSAITGAAGADLQFYRDQAAEIGRTTTLSASQAADAFKLIASAQPQLLKNADALAQVTKEAVALAEATGSTLPQAAQALGSALNQFQLDASEAGNIINILAASSQLGTAEVANVTEALRNAGSAANSLGLDFAETVAGIQALAASGRQGADAGTALRQVLLRLENTADKTLQPSIVGLNGALNELAGRNLNNTQLIKLFGQEAFTAATSLLAQRNVVDELNVSLRGTTTAYDQQAIRVNTFTGDVKALGSAFEALQISVLGDELDGFGRDVVQAATAAVNGLTDNLDTLADVGQVVALVFGARMAGAISTNIAAFTAAQIQAIRYQATLASMAGVSTTTAASLGILSGAAAAASRAMAFLGGPVGVIALAVGALFLFSDRAETASERSQRLARDVDDLTNSFKKLTEEQLRNEYNAQAARAFVTLPADLARVRSEIDKYTKVIDDANRAQAQGSGRESQYGVQSKEVANARKELERLNTEADRLEEQLLLSERAVENLGTKLATFKDDSRSASDSAEQLGGRLSDQVTEFQKLQDSIILQIIALQENEEAAERYQIMQRLGVEATEEEIAAVDTLLGRLNQLRAQREAERQAEQAARKEERKAEEAARNKEQRATRIADLEQEIQLQNVRNQLGNDEYEIRAAIAALGEDASEGEVSRITELVQQMQQLRLEAQLIGPTLEQSLTQTALGALDQFSNSLADVIIQGGSLREVFAGVAQTIATELLGALIRYGIQNALVSSGIIAGKAAETAAVTGAIATQTGAAVAAQGVVTSGAVASGVAITAAMAPAAAATSIATIGAAPAAATPIALGSIAAIVAALVGGYAIFGRALGGTVSGGMPYMVGERGPELFTPNASGGGNITPFNQLMNTARGGQKQQVQAPVINFYGMERQPQVRSRFSQEDARWVTDVIVGESGPGGRVQRAITASTTATTRTR